MFIMLYLKYKFKISIIEYFFHCRLFTTSAVLKRGLSFIKLLLQIDINHWSMYFV